MCKDLACHRQKGNTFLLPQTAWSPLRLKIVTMFASFHCWGSCLEFQVGLSRMKWCSLWSKYWPSYLNISARMPSGPDALLFLSPFTACVTSCKLDGASKPEMNGNCGSWSSKFGLCALMELRSSLRCSAQRARMPCWSLISVEPSLDRTGWKEWGVGLNTALIASKNWRDSWASARS